MNIPVDRMIRKASKSLCRYRVAALAMDHRGRPMAIAFNSPRFSKARGGKHAEMAVLQKVNTNLVDTIYIVRVNKIGQFLPIKPCVTCACTCSKLGIKIKTVGDT